MRFNKNLDLLIEVPFIKDFMVRHQMQAKMCSAGENYSLIFFRLPYVIELRDDLIENYLEIYLSDADGELSIEGGAALGCSLELHLQDIATIRARGLANDVASEIFISENFLKTRNLYSNLEAIDRLLPLIESKGGLSSMSNGFFDSRFDFSNYVRPMYAGLKEKYLHCIGNCDGRFT